VETTTLHISAATTTNSTTGDADLQIVVVAPLSQGVTGDLETNGYARQETEEQFLTKWRWTMDNGRCPKYDNKEYICTINTGTFFTA
jgi:hypothetical protein